MSGWHIRDKSKVTIGAWLHKRTESCVMTTAHGHTRSTEPYSLLLTAKGMYVVRIHIKHCNIYLLFLPPPPSFCLLLLICCCFCFLFVCLLPEQPLFFLFLFFSWCGILQESVRRMLAAGLFLAPSDWVNWAWFTMNCEVHVSHACWWMNVIWPTSGLNAKAYA